MTRAKDRGHHRLAWVLSTALACVAWLTGPARADVEQLLERVPAGAQAVVVWHGFDEDDPAYAGSYLKAMLDETELIERWSALFDVLMEQAAEDDPDAAEVAEVMRGVGPAVWRNPWVVYFHSIDFTQAQRQIAGERDIKPAVTMGFLVEPGDDEAAFRPWAEKLFDEIEGERDFQGSEVVLVDEPGVLGVVTRAPDAAPEAVLPDDDRFAEPVYQDGRAPYFAIYADTSALLETIRDAVTFDGEDTDEFDRVVDAFGLDGFGRLVWTGDFADRDWVTVGWVEAPAPRNGIPALLDHGPMDPALMTRTTPGAQWARVSRLDMAKAWDVIVGGIRQVIEEDEAEEFDAGLAKLNGMLSYDLREDLLAHLGDAWLLYSDPAFGGMYGSGVAIVNELGDAEKVNEVLLVLQDILNAQLVDQGSPFTVQTLDMGDVEVHTVPIPFFAPSWAIDDGRWLFANSPQAVMTAVAAARNGGASIVDSPAYAAVRPWLEPDGNADPVGLMVVDLNKTAMTMYQSASMIVGMMAGPMKQEMGIDATRLLPPLGAILNNLHPAGLAVWLDDTGYHSRLRTPFPGATLLSPDTSASTGNPAVVALGVGIMLPALGAARESARDAVSLSNLRQLCIAMLVYAEDHKGAWPADFAVLRDGGYMVDDPSVLNHPADARGLAAGEPSYVMVPLDRPWDQIQNPSETVVVFERDDFSGNGTVGVGFVDGHAERMPLQQADALLVEQTGRTVAEWNEQADAARIDP